MRRQDCETSSFPRTPEPIPTGLRFANDVRHTVPLIDSAIWIPDRARDLTALRAARRSLPPSLFELRRTRVRDDGWGCGARCFNVVIASASEAIQSLAAAGFWIASSLTLLAMTARHVIAFSRRVSPEFCPPRVPPHSRGRRECRVHAAPAVSCANSAKRNAHEHTGSAEAVRHPLRSGFTVYIALSSGTGLSCPRRPHDAKHHKRA